MLFMIYISHFSIIIFNLNIIQSLKCNYRMKKDRLTINKVPHQKQENSIFVYFYRYLFGKNIVICSPLAQPGEKIINIYKIIVKKTGKST